MDSICTGCSARLAPDDGHDTCPPCLGLAHLRQALTDEACSNCSCLPYTARAARLAAVEDEFLDCSGMPSLSPVEGHHKRRATSTAPRDPKRQRQEADPLSQKVDTLAAEFAQIKALLLNLQPNAVAAATAAAPAAAAPPHHGARAVLHEDAISIAASDSLFTEGYAEHESSGGEGGTHSPHRSESSSLGTEGEVPQEPGSDLIMARQAIQLALSRLGLDVPAEAASTNEFFRGKQVPKSFSVPTSEAFVRELHSSWGDPKSHLRFQQDCRALFAMEDAAKLGLDRSPLVDPAIAALVVSPDEALRSDARCPRAQCRLTDDYLTKSYDTAARMARLGNSLSHLVLALSQSLQTAGADAPTQGLSDISLRTFAYMTRELGRLMSTLTLARRQVWLAQAPLSSRSRQSLLRLPAVPGTVFGPAAVEALDRGVQARKSRRQYADLRQESASRTRQPRPSYPAAGAQSSSGGRRSFPRQDQPRQDPPQPSFRAPTGRAPGRGARASRPPGPSKARGSRP